jgi:nucleotide-binding universal stress UspA family protein
MRALCARRVAAAFAKTGTKRFVFVFVFVLRTVPSFASCAWIDQAYGKPTERVERKYPSSIDDLEQMDEEQLARLVAEGRRQRLAAQGLQSVPDPSDWRRRDPSLGVIDG